MNTESCLKDLTIEIFKAIGDANSVSNIRKIVDPQDLYYEQISKLLLEMEKEKCVAIRNCVVYKILTCRDFLILKGYLQSKYSELENNLNKIQAGINISSSYWNGECCSVQIFPLQNLSLNVSLLVQQVIALTKTVEEQDEKIKNLTAAHNGR